MLGYSNFQKENLLYRHLSPVKKYLLSFCDGHQQLLETLPRTQRLNHLQHYSTQVFGKICPVLSLFYQYYDQIIC